MTNISFAIEKVITVPAAARSAAVAENKPTKQAIKHAARITKPPKESMQAVGAW